MTIHRVADLLLSSTSAMLGLSPVVAALQYHMLRTMGWEWLWECDSEILAGPPNHITDGNMETAGVADWTAISGGSAAKITSGVREGTQSLRVTSTVTPGSGVRSAVLLTMSDAETYKVVLWAKNSSGKTWTIEADDGSGLFSSIGLIADNGGTWTRYVFELTTDAGPGGSRYISIVCNDTPAGGETIDIDWVIVFRSFFEYPGDTYVRIGTDGILQNNDEFRSSAYTLQASDVGKHLFVYDATNTKNTGCYEIASVLAGVATLDMRGSRTFTANTVLTWRIVDLIKNGFYEVSGNAQNYMGFALESPHTSSWRYVCRYYSGGYKAFRQWVSPVGADLNVQTGDFFEYEFSTQRRREFDFTNGDVSNPISVDPNHVFCAVYAGVIRTSRNCMLISGDGAYFVTVHFATVGGAEHALNVVGYMGTDADHPGIQEFCIFSPWESENEANNIVWDDTITCALHNGTGFDKFGRAIDSSTVQTPYITANTSVLNFANARDNPFTSEEVLLSPRITRQRVECIAPSIRDMDIGLYIGRKATDYTLYESNTLLHVKNGVWVDWDGESHAP